MGARSSTEGTQDGVPRVQAADDELQVPAAALRVQAPEGDVPDRGVLAMTSRACLRPSDRAVHLFLRCSVRDEVAVTAHASRTPDCDARWYNTLLLSRLSARRRT